MINTILFDMGGTLEDIWYNDETRDLAVKKVGDLLEKYGLGSLTDDEDSVLKIMEGVKKYKAWSESVQLELKPEDIWPKYYLETFPLQKEKLKEVSEKLASMWEETYYHRELRPHVKETMVELKRRGYRLGVISNTASLYSVFDMLEKYGIRALIENVTLSSVTGYRKPHRNIFEIALREMGESADRCAYVGDTLSRDIIGAKRAGFAKAVQIQSFLTRQKDEGIDSEYRPDHVIEDIGDLLAIF